MMSASVICSGGRNGSGDTDEACTDAGRGTMVGADEETLLEGYAGAAVSGVVMAAPAPIGSTATPLLSIVSRRRVLPIKAAAADDDASTTRADDAAAAAVARA